MQPTVAPNNPAPTTDYNTAFNEEGSVYQPQLNDVATEQQQLATQTQQSQAVLDQAKVNAFTNNALTSNARGIMYSGYTPAQNTAYTTNTYNPDVQKLQTSNANQATTLQEKIDQLNQSRANDAQNLVATTTQANATAAAAAARAQASAAKTANTASSAIATKAASASVVQGSQGQYMYVGSNGKPINMQQYVTNTGGDANTILNLLKNGTSYDKAIYSKLATAKPQGAAFLNMLRELDTKKAYGF